MKKIVLFVTLIFAFSGIAYAAGVNGQYNGKDIVKVKYEGQEVKPDVVPGYLDDGNTMIPLGMLRKMGVTVDWDQKSLTATVKLPPPRTVPVLIQSQLDELAKAAYLVYGSTDDPTKVRQGSGFIVDGTLITNYHVGGESKEVSVQIDGQWQKTSQTTFENESVDIMGIPVSGGRELPVSTELPQVGDPVYDISFPHGKLKVTEGEVYGITQGQGGYTKIVHTAAIEGGSSGGMLLNGKGQIIGVNELVMADKSFTIPIKYVIDELN